MELPLNERLSVCDTEREWLDKMTVSSFFLSAADIAKQTYFEWVLDRLNAVYEIPDGYPLYSLLKYAKQLNDQDVEWGWEFEPQGPPNCGHGFELLYEILIETFYLMAFAGRDPKTYET